MAWTSWKQPRKTQELESNEIPFDQVPRDNAFTSSKPVSGIGNFFGGLTTRESTAIAFTDFGFDTEGKEVVGVELFLHASRLGRSQDKVISLYFNDPVGLNRSDLAATDEYTYEGDLASWGVENLDIDFTSENFGVVVDLQPHTQYPCNVTIYIRRVQVRLQLA